MFNHDAQIASCEAELEVLVKTKANIEQRIYALQQTLVGLRRLRLASMGSPMGGHDLMTGPPVQIEGLTEECRRMVRLAQGVPLTPMQVKENLDSIGFDFSRYSSNPLSSIHTTLKRMRDAGEVKEVQIVGQGTAYRWVGGPSPRNRLMPPNPVKK